MKNSTKLLSVSIAVLLLNNFLSGRSPRSLASVELKVTKAHVEFALEEFKSAMGRYPTETEGLQVLVDCRKMPKCPIDSHAYMDKRYTLDPWKRLFKYKISPTDKPSVTSLGEDGVIGGSGPSRDFDLLLDNLEGLDPIDYRGIIQKVSFYILILTVFLIPLALIKAFVSIKALYWRVFFGIVMIFYLISILFALGSLSS
ncbi:MAG: type II secretion system protein GspG [Leptospiraceae bacterium]|nr:type II secretion system protein GspG [Leptospiraceae bacterium]